MHGRKNIKLTCLLANSCFVSVARTVCMHSILLKCRIGFLECYYKFVLLIIGLKTLYRQIRTFHEAWILQSNRRSTGVAR